MSRTEERSVDERMANAQDDLDDLNDVNHFNDRTRNKFTSFGDMVYLWYVWRHTVFMHAQAVGRLRGVSGFE